MSRSVIAHNVCSAGVIEEFYPVNCLANRGSIGKVPIEILSIMLARNTNK